MSTKEEIFNELCRTYDGYAWAYPHIKPGAWLVARPEMQIEVKNALTEHAKHESLPLPITRNKNNATVIYLRCKVNDTVLAHEAYGPVGFSHYKPAADSENIVIISVAKHGICVEIRTELVNYLTKLNNKVNIKIQTESVYDDYIQLVYAPRLFCDVSTFCLTTGLASQGVVYMPKLWETHMVFAIDRFIWSTESLVLLPHMKKSLGIECEEGCPHFSEHDKFLVKKWLWDH